MIESGSLVPGVSASAFCLPPHTAMRFEIPDARLLPALADYHVLDSDGPYLDGVTDWLLPGWPAIGIALVDRPIALQLGNRRYDPLPVAALYGTTTRATQVTSYGGVTVGINIGPLGWARLFSRSAASCRDRITPLGELMPGDVVDDLVAALRASDRGPGVKPILDRFFLDQLGSPSADEAVIRQIMALIVDPATRDLRAAADGIGLGYSRLRRLSVQYFGYPPKILLNRARFMRIFFRMVLDPGVDHHALIAETYHDVPHYLRDARRFLGTTPRRFIAQSSPSLHAYLRARRIVFGAAHEAGLLRPRAG